MDEMFLQFVGPFSWFGTGDAVCVYGAKEVLRAGIYLWTVPGPDSQLVYYVGENWTHLRHEAAPALKFFLRT